MSGAAPEPGTFVVVLANSMSPDGVLNAASSARLARAAEVLSRLPDAQLVTSGWGYAEAPARPIAGVMAAEAVRRHRIDPARILESPRARDTVGDAVFFAADIPALAPPPGSVTVVTSAAHAPRAAEIFRFVLGRDVPVALATTDEPVTEAERAREAASLAAFRATFGGIAPGDLPAILNRLHSAHPLYNGDVYGPDSTGVVR